MANEIDLAIESQPHANDSLLVVGFGKSFSVSEPESKKMIMSVLARAAMGNDQALNGQDDEVEPRIVARGLTEQEAEEEDIAHNSGLPTLQDEADSRHGLRDIADSSSMPDDDPNFSATEHITMKVLKLNDNQGSTASLKPFFSQEIEGRKGTDDLGQRLLQNNRHPQSQVQHRKHFNHVHDMQVRPFCFNISMFLTQNTLNTHV